MKKLVAIALLAFSFSSMAASVKTRIPSLAGKIEASGGLDITSVKIEIENHFCSIGTCAGGPSEYKDTEAKVVISADGSSVNFSTKKAMSFSSRKLFGNFSSCSVNISVAGRSENGTPVNGYLSIAYTRDAKECGSEKLMAEKIRSSLAKPISATVVNSNSILLEATL